MLTVTNVTKKYKNFLANDNVSWPLPQVASTTVSPSWTYSDTSFMASPVVSLNMFPIVNHQTDS